MEAGWSEIRVEQEADICLRGSGNIENNYHQCCTLLAHMGTIENTSKHFTTLYVMHKFTQYPRIFNQEICSWGRTHVR